MSFRFHDVQLSGTITIRNERLLASASQIDNAVSPSLQSITESTTLTANLHNRTLLIDNAAGLTITLPTATGSGTLYRLVTLTGLTSGSLVIQVAASTDDTFVGTIIQHDTGAPPPSPISMVATKTNDYDTITFSSTTSGGQAGDEMIIQDIGSQTWFLGGRVIAANSAANPFTSVITAA